MSVDPCGAFGPLACVISGTIVLGAIAFALFVTVGILGRGRRGSASASGEKTEQPRLYR
jgi:hypothetical protein